VALTSPTSGDYSVGIVRLRTKATEFACFVCFTSTCIFPKKITFFVLHELFVTLIITASYAQNIVSEMQWFESRDSSVIRQNFKTFHSYLFRVTKYQEHCLKLQLTPAQAFHVGLLTKTTTFRSTSTKF
jgi:hypothetical protein